jgi:serine/threonine protein kinase
MEEAVFVLNPDLVPPKGPILMCDWQPYYQKLKKIDRGAFGVIWKCRRTHDGKEFVLKWMELSKSDHESRQQAKQEAAIHSSLNNLYVVNHEKTFVTKEGSLYSLVYSSFDLNVIACLFIECC